MIETTRTPCRACGWDMDEELREFASASRSMHLTEKGWLCSRCLDAPKKTPCCAVEMAPGQEIYICVKCSSKVCTSCSEEDGHDGIRCKDDCPSDGRNNVAGGCDYA
jgi:DNA-directed RNA polymerase subunit RPC12/RpoP